MRIKINNVSRSDILAFAALAALIIGGLFLWYTLDQKPMPSDLCALKPTLPFCPRVL
jgi:hypothetical protein